MVLYPLSREGGPAISTSPKNYSVPDTLPVSALLEAPSSTRAVLPFPHQETWNKLFSHPLLAPVTHTNFQHPTTHTCTCQPSVSPEPCPARPFPILPVFNSCALPVSRRHPPGASPSRPPPHLGLSPHPIFRNPFIPLALQIFLLSP